jgi:hypothetical protein
MSKLLRQNQNTLRALELRIEEEACGKYNVILAGMVIHHNQNCRNGTCEGNFMYTDNLTYKVIPSNDFDDAEAVYESLKRQFMD